MTTMTLSRNVFERFRYLCVAVLMQHAMHSQQNLGLVWLEQGLFISTVMN